MRILWKNISHAGLHQPGLNEQSKKRLIFFNQVLFIGFFATLSQIAFVWPFLGTDSFIFTIGCFSLLACLGLNTLGKFKLSKWIYLFSIYGLGILTTIYIGGAALYHIQSVLIFLSCLILFDPIKERLEILVGIPLMLLSILIGEYGWLGAADFSDHYWVEYARLANISSLILVSTILVIFIIRLNVKNEKALSVALNALQEKTSLLEEGNEELEKAVAARTRQLTKQNEEKEVLLREVHHRVRNNLQIIISLLNLQQGKINDEGAIEALREIKGRVESMSLVHQRMYQSSNFKEVQLADYLDRIIENIGEIYSKEKFRYTINSNSEVLVNLEAAIPLGLILNEIVSNYFKHACNADQNAQFMFELEIRDETLLVRYNDDGKGFPTHFEESNSSSLGMELIKNLTEQLDGRFSFLTDNGAVYLLEIPMNSVKHA